MLPGASRRKGIVPQSLPRHHPLLLVWQQTRESLPGICGPYQRGIRFIRKSKDCKHEAKQENEASVGLARNAKLCPLLRGSTHSFSPLAVTDSTFPLLNTQPLPPKRMLLNWRGLKILPEWLQLCLINASPSSFPQSSLTKKRKTPHQKIATRMSISKKASRCNFPLKSPFVCSLTHKRNKSFWDSQGLKGTGRSFEAWSQSL